MDKVISEMTQAPKIIYTHTDEAPALATYSFLPFVKAFCESAGITVETRDISLAGRILAHFPDELEPERRVHDALAELGELAELPEANIIKLPNISASVPQLKAAIAELQSQGYDLPDYPEDPSDDIQRDVKSRYDSVKGSAVNPVLRQGNSDRRAPKAVKAYAKAHPHSMGAWSNDSKSTVATMDSGDFRNNEQSLTMQQPDTVRIEHIGKSGDVTLLKEGVDLQAGEVLDATFMSRKALVAFLQRQVEEAKSTGVLFSLHMKATMMKVSDPIIFGHAVRIFFSSLFEKHGATFERLGVDVNNGFGDLVTRRSDCPTTSVVQSKPTSRRSTTTVRPSPWWIPTAASPICMCPAM